MGIAGILRNIKESLNKNWRIGSVYDTLDIFLIKKCTVKAFAASERNRCNGRNIYSIQTYKAGGT